jgi:hypothetical protein
MELGSILEGIHEGLSHFPLNVQKTANIRPATIWHLDRFIAQGRRCLRPRVEWRVKRG